MNRVACIFLMVLSMVNLFFYAWGNQLPANLAMGIMSGFISLLNLIIERTKK